MSKSKLLEFEEMYMMHLKSIYTMHAEYLKKSEESQDFDRVNHIKGIMSGVEMALDAFNYIYELSNNKNGTTPEPQNSYDGGKIIVVKTKN